MTHTDHTSSQISRRSFLRSATLASAAILLPSDEFGLWTRKKKIGLQLYTLRKIMNDSNTEQVLERIAEIGYKELEIFGYDPSTKFWGKDAKIFKKLLKQHGLKAPSAHINFEGFLVRNDVDGFKRLADAALQVNNKYLVVAWLDEQHRITAAHYEMLAKKLNEAAAIAKGMGLQMAYHNHDFEFNPLLGSKTGYDILISQTDPQLIKMELDIYWCSKAGINAIDLFKTYPGRFPLWHVKDMDAATRAFTEVGTGTIDYVSIFEQATTAGLKHFFVEQDETREDEWKSIARSYSYVKTTLLPRL